jgi:hypothetical protein
VSIGELSIRFVWQFGQVIFRSFIPKYERSFVGFFGLRVVMRRF